MCDADDVHVRDRVYLFSPPRVWKRARVHLPVTGAMVRSRENPNRKTPPLINDARLCSVYLLFRFVGYVILILFAGAAANIPHRDVAFFSGGLAREEYAMR